MSFLFLLSALSMLSFLIILCVLLSFVLGWNNSGLTTGNLTNLLTYNAALVLTLVGMLTGLLVEGPKMTHSILGKLVITELSPTTVMVGVGVSLLLFFILTLTKIPVSLSNCVVGAFVGVAVSSQASLSLPFIVEIVASWFIAPFFCMGIAILIYVVITRSESSLSLPTISWLNRLVLLSIVFYVAYAFGANNVGMILSFVFHTKLNVTITSSSELCLEILIYLGIAFGTVLFGKTIAKVVGEKIVGLSQIKTLSAMLATAFVTWLFTQFAVPVSLTQVVIGGMLGAGAAKGPTIINKAELITMTRRWTIVTLISTGLGLLAEYAYLVIK